MKLCIFAACVVAAMSAEARLRLRDSEGNQAVIRFSGSEGLKIPEHTDVLANVVARVGSLETSLSNTNTAWLEATESLNNLLSELTTDVSKLAKRVTANEEAHTIDEEALESAKRSYLSADTALTSQIKRANEDRKREDDLIREKVIGHRKIAADNDRRIEDRLNTEITNRGEGDTRNSQQISQERSDRVAADERLTTRIQTEEGRRQTVDSDLNSKITANRDNIIEGDRQNNDKITEERTQRVEADDKTNDRITTESRARMDEDRRIRATADQERSDRVAGDQRNDAAITKERQDRVTEDQRTNSRVDKEVQDRTSEDVKRDTKISTERNERIAEDEKNQQRIATEREERKQQDASIRATADNDRAARDSKDKVLNDRISTEGNTRSTQDSRIEGRLNTEITNRADGDRAVEDRVNSKIQTNKDARKTEDANLHDRIDAANNARSEGDSTLHTKFANEKENTRTALETEANRRQTAIANEANTRESQIENAKNEAKARSDQVAADSVARDEQLQKNIDEEAEGTVTCDFTVDNHVQAVYVDGKDVSSQVTGNLNHWPDKKTLTFSSLSRTLAIRCDDAEQGCHNGGLAIRCRVSGASGPGQQWVVNSGERERFSVASSDTWDTPPNDSSDRPWYAKDYKEGTRFGLPRSGYTGYADGVIGVPDMCAPEQDSDRNNKMWFRFTVA